MTLLELTNDNRENLVKTKSLHDLITSSVFLNAYNNTSKVNQDKILTFIFNKDKINIVKWLHRETGHIPITKLRKLSKEYGIKNYNRLTTYRLMLQLNKYLTEEEILSHLYN